MMLCVLAAPAAAATINVTVTNDPVGASCPGANCSLRAAVSAAANTDTVSIPSGTYTVTQGAAIANAPGAGITINGAGAASTIIDAAGNGANALFNFVGSQKLDNVTVMNAQGSAISLNGGLTLDNDIFHDNVGPSGGGAVNIIFGSATIKGSLFYANTAGTQGAGANGGALYNQTGNGSTGFTITDSTFSGNKAIGPGARGGAIDMLAGNVNLTNVTIANNTAVAGGGGVQQEGGTINNHITAINTILASNTSTAGGGNCDRTGNGDFILTSSNIVYGDQTLCTKGSAPANAQKTTDPLLGSLVDNGGPTPTLSIPPGSPAKDQGVVGGTASDQRGVARPQGAAKDIGAYELVQNGNLAISMTAPPSVAAAGSPITYTITVSPSGPAGDGVRPTVNDVLPANVSLVSATPTQGVCNGTTTITCTLGFVANGATPTIMLTVTAQGGDVTNTATVTSARPDSTASDDVASASTTVPAAPSGGDPGGGTPGGGTPSGGDPGGGTPSGGDPGGGTPSGGTASACQKVPKVVGRTIASARKRLRKAGCKGKLKIRGHARPGHRAHVRRQVPKAGRRYGPKRTITLYIR